MELNDLLKDKSTLRELITKKTDDEIKSFLKGKGLTLSDDQLKTVKEAVAKLKSGEDDIKAAAGNILKGMLKK